MQGNEHPRAHTHLHTHAHAHTEFLFTKFIHKVLVGFHKTQYEGAVHWDWTRNHVAERQAASHTATPAPTINKI